MIKEELTIEDFESLKVFDYLYSLIGNVPSNEFQRIVQLARKKAGWVGYGSKKFDEIWRKYKDDRSRELSIMMYEEPEDDSESSEHRYIRTGFWSISKYGIAYMGEQICPNPILPIQFEEDDITGNINVLLWFALNGESKFLLVGQEKLAMSGTLLATLSSKGVLITSDTAKYMVQFFRDILTLNIDIIPRIRTTPRLGWTRDNLFVPFSKNIVHKGDTSFKVLAESICSNGNYDSWLKAINFSRNDKRQFNGKTVNSIVTRIVLAASFAAPLCKPLDKHGFVVHIQGDPSTGKSIAQKLAASVWGVPAEPGEGYIQSSNGTLPGYEKLATFLQSLPIILDDTQLFSADAQKFIYMITQGAGKTRATDGIQNTWQTLAITSGEKPICTRKTADGARNRTLTLDINGTALVSDPADIVPIIENNYGFGGKLLIESLTSDVIQHLKTSHETYRQHLIQKGVEPRQAMIGALILVADHLSEEVIFQDGLRLSEDDISNYLIHNDAIIRHEEYKELLDEYIISSRHKFSKSAKCAQGFLEYAKADDGSSVITDAWIMSGAFSDFCRKHDLDEDMFLSWLNRNNLIEKRNDRYRIQKRFGGKRLTFIHYYMADIAE